MGCPRILVCCALVACVAAVDLPPGGVPALAETPEWGGQFQPVTVDGPGFDRAWEVTSDQRAEFYRVQLGTPLAQPVAAGDVLLVRCWARTTASRDETGNGLVHIYIQKNGPNYEKPLHQQASVGSQWTELVFAARIPAAYPAEGMALQFGFGVTEQTVQVGDVEVLNYGPDVALADLPVVRPSYGGREADAAWRAPAAARIRELRTAPLRLRVLDADGRPVAGAEVRVTLARHDFDFGSALTVRHLTGDSEDARIYRDQVQALFTSGTLENGLKWGAWEGQWGTEKYGREKALAALRWCAGHDLEMRGHVMVWPGKRHLPKQVQAQLEAGDAAGVRAACAEHIDDLAQATRGLLEEWDVVNEPYANHDIMDLCGQEIMVEWFARAREHLPETPLALNDYGILTAHSDDTHVQHFEHTLRFLIERGAPIDVIGMQGHFGSLPPSIDRILATLDRFAELGLAIRVTEFDVNTADQALQADFTRDFMTAVFSHEAVIGFQLWGFWAGAHWRDQAAMYDRDWTERPNGAAYRQLLFETWHTDETVTTAADGGAELRGYLGVYTITIGDHTTTATLTRDGDPITIQLP